MKTMGTKNDEWQVSFPHTGLSKEVSSIWDSGHELYLDLFLNNNEGNGDYKGLVSVTNKTTGRNWVLTNVTDQYGSTVKDKNYSLTLKLVLDKATGKMYDARKRVGRIPNRIFYDECSDVNWKELRKRLGPRTVIEKPSWCPLFVHRFIVKHFVKKEKDTWFSHTFSPVPLSNHRPQDFVGMTLNCEVSDGVLNWRFQLREGFELCEWCELRCDECQEHHQHVQRKI